MLVMNRSVVMKKKLLLTIIPALLLCNISTAVCEENKEIDVLNTVEKAVLYYFPFSIYTALYEDEYVKSICILKIEFGKTFIQENLLTEKVSSIKENREEKNTKRFNAQVLIEFIDGNGYVLLSVVLGGSYFFKIDGIYYDLTEADYDFFRSLIPPALEADFEQLKKIINNRDAPPLPLWNPFEDL